MGLLDTLAGYTSMGAGTNNIYYICATGFSPNTTYVLWVAQLDTDLLNDVSIAGNVTTNANGSGFFQKSQAGAGSISYVMHNSTDAHKTDRCSNEVGLVWVAGGPVPVYYDQPPVMLYASPGDAKIAYAWSPPTPNDSRFTRVQDYKITNETTSGTVTGYTQTSRTSTGLTNGTQQCFHVEARLRYLDDLILIDGTFPPPYAIRSNTLCATPKALLGIKQSVGVLAA
jgi:hypothetical protein